MVLILLLLAIAGAIIWPVVVYDRKRAKEGNNFTDNYCNIMGTSIVSAVIIVLVLAVSWGISYNSYVKARVFYDATREQYAEAVVVYKDHAVIDMGKAAFTDLKYQGYQDNVSQMINILRREIVRYNKNIVSKRVMAKNLFFSWLIIEPDDDMKIIKMKAPMAGMSE